MKIVIENDGEESEHELPAKKEVCWDCQGHGMVMNASMRNHAYSAEEFLDSFDEEEREHYFRRGGMYDVQCPTCKGHNVIDVIDREACEKEPNLKEILILWDKQEEKRIQADAEMRAEERWERMMMGDY